MAKLGLRFRSGDTDERVIHERMTCDKLFDYLFRNLGLAKVISFATAPESGEEMEYGVVGVNMADVVTFNLALTRSAYCRGGNLVKRGLLSSNATNADVGHLRRGGGDGLTGQACLTSPYGDRGRQSSARVWS